MIWQYLNFLNQNSASAKVNSSVAVAEEKSINGVDGWTDEEAIDTSFDHLEFPFANMARGLMGFEKFKNSVADLVSPPPFHDPAGAIGFTFSASPATFICASAD